MTIEHTRMSDHLDIAAGYQRPTSDLSVIRGQLHVVLAGPDGAIKYDEQFDNIVTQVGDQFYGERAAGVGGAPAAATGMQLGTGTTTPSKTGAGAAIVTLVASSLVALSSTPTSALSGSSRRITYTVTWTAGTATANAIAEVALVNQSTGTQTAAPASATISRALLSPTVNKAAGDSLTIQWQHDILGA
jgi:hypothetical protein